MAAMNPMLMMVSYCHPGNTAVRFRQMAVDEIPSWAVDVKDEPFNDEEKIIMVYRPQLVNVITNVYRGNLLAAKTDFDALGPYDFAKKHDLLVDNSAEETALLFMSMVNNIWPGAY